MAFITIIVLPFEVTFLICLLERLFSQKPSQLCIFENIISHKTVCSKFTNGSHILILNFKTFFFCILIIFISFQKIHAMFKLQHYYKHYKKKKIIIITIK